MKTPINGRTTALVQAPQLVQLYQITKDFVPVRRRCNRCLYKPWAYGMATVEGHKLLYYECYTCGDFKVVEAHTSKLEVVAP